MAEVEMHVQATPDEVFAVLADGWTYAGWVVGASHIRAVDAEWPAIGARVHHSVGPWPATVEDVTIVRDVVPGRMIDLHARAWPFGTARVRLDLAAEGTGTRITMTEHATQGPARLLPAGLQAVMLVPRNREALRRLAALAVRRQQPVGEPDRVEPAEPDRPEA